MILPTIHLNGSARSDLHTQYRDAHDAVQQALVALRKAYPHGRDYYTQGPDAGRDAMREHDARMAAVAKVLADLEALAIHTMAPLERAQ